MDTWTLNHPNPWQTFLEDGKRNTTCTSFYFDKIKSSSQEATCTDNLKQHFPIFYSIATGKKNESYVYICYTFKNRNIPCTTLSRCPCCFSVLKNINVFWIFFPFKDYNFICRFLHRALAMSFSQQAAIYICSY